MDEMNNDPLFEFKNGRWCYQGLDTDTDEEHKSKCPTCRDLPGDIMVAHGQRTKRRYEACKALREVL